MFSIIFAICQTISMFIWGNWHNWRKYYPTILFIIVGDLVYNLICYKYSLWFYTSELFKHTIINLIIDFINFPTTVILYLTLFPTTKVLYKQSLFILLCSVIFTLLEEIALLFNSIGYSNGWNLGWSFIFNIVMFTVLILHHKESIWTYPICIIFTIILLFIFKVPYGSLK